MAAPKKKRSSTPLSQEDDRDVDKSIEELEAAARGERGREPVLAILELQTPETGVLAFLSTGFIK